MNIGDIAESIARDISAQLATGQPNVVVMITGPPAMGKTTLCDQLTQLLGVERTAILSDDRELYPRSIRAKLNISGIDYHARHMDQMKEDLARITRGMPIPNKMYRRLPDQDPSILLNGQLETREIILLDGFTWCYKDFDGLWDIKYVLLPYAFEDSERMSSERDLKERYYYDTAARYKHFICYRTYVHNSAQLRTKARRIFRVTPLYQYTDEESVSPRLLSDLSHGQPLLQELVLGHEQLTEPVSRILRRGEYLGNVFFMSKFRTGDPKFDALVETVKEVCSKHLYRICIAEQAVCDDVWDNVRAHMLASNIGIAVFDQMDGQPPSQNIFIESGFMLGRGRTVLCLVQAGTTMPIDYIGKIVRYFDGSDSARVRQTVSQALDAWLGGLGSTQQIRRSS